METNASGYFTLKEEVRIRLPVGKCRFITTAAPVEDEQEARAFIQRVREEFADATHNVYAYRLGSGDAMVERSSDDREPAGTGGPPVLAILQKNNVSDAAAVVSRYFGGVKLGVGGLIRAYRSAAEEGIGQARLISKVRQEKLLVRIPYENLGTVLKVISSRQGDIIDIEYGQEVAVRISLQSGNKQELARELHDATRGKGILEG